MGHTYVDTVGHIFLQNGINVGLFFDIYYVSSQKPGNVSQVFFLHARDDQKIASEPHFHKPRSLNV